MDFVLLGFSTGALLILLGRAVRAFGPRYRRRQLDPSVPFPHFAAGLAWRRVCRGVGLVAAVTGVVICLLTFLLLLVGVSDRTGMVIVLFSFLAALIAVGIWTLLFMHPEWRSAERTPAVSALGGRLEADTGARFDAASASWPKGAAAAGEDALQLEDDLAEVETGDRDRSASATWPRQDDKAAQERDRPTSAISSNI